MRPHASPTARFPASILASASSSVNTRRCTLCVNVYQSSHGIATNSRTVAVASSLCDMSTKYEALCASRVPVYAPLFPFFPPVSTNAFPLASLFACRICHSTGARSPTLNTGVRSPLNRPTTYLRVGCVVARSAYARVNRATYSSSFAHGASSRSVAPSSFVPRALSAISNPAYDVDSASRTSRRAFVSASIAARTVGARASMARRVASRSPGNRTRTSIVDAGASCARFGGIARRRPGERGDVTRGFARIRFLRLSCSQRRYALLRVVVC